MLRSTVLLVADATAEPQRKEGEPIPDIRYLTVTYSKKREIGRHVASHPSSQLAFSLGPKFLFVFAVFAHLEFYSAASLISVMFAFLRLDRTLRSLRFSPRLNQVC